MPSRLGRAAVFAAASTALAVSAHRLAGGDLPDLATTALAGGLVLLLGYWLSARERGGRQITALVLVTQALLHIGFMLSMTSHMMAASASSTQVLSGAQLAKMMFCFPGASPPSAAQIAAAMSDMGISQLTVGGASAATHMASQMDLNPFTPSGLCMLSAHFVAAAAMAWWLRRGERAAWAAIERVVTRVVSAVSPSLVLAAPLRMPVVAELWLPTQQVWGSGRSGRGPPARRRLILLTA